LKKNLPNRRIKPILFYRGYVIPIAEEIPIKEDTGIKLVKAMNCNSKYRIFF
jgi:hypothetical protein